ncbi:hypothetical protein Godav_023134 [Gossypium davidsonii]|uniref:Uncharacterized protein n=1 Tax=Gossypium davidsonii TaxID=34287 RepID=A0A7J8SQS3_GOSDV|nr:hypothetical protein [Gossypium davidsonii]
MIKRKHRFHVKATCIKKMRIINFVL